MDKPSSEIERQIEAAYSFRGYVTLKFRNGGKLECYVFNRVYANPRMKEDCFIEVFPRGSGERKRFSISSLDSVALTGEDCAAGKSYEDYLKKQKNPSPPTHG